MSVIGKAKSDDHRRAIEAPRRKHLIVQKMAENRGSPTQSLRMQLDKVAELVSLSSSLRLRVNSRNSSARRLSSVFVPSSPSPPPAAVAPPAAAVPPDDTAMAALKEENARLREENEGLKEDNRMLTEDFENAVSVVRQVTDAHKSQLSSRPSEETLLAELATMQRDNERLNAKVNNLLLQISKIAYVDE